MKQSDNTKLTFSTVPFASFISRIFALGLFALVGSICTPVCAQNRTDGKARILVLSETGGHHVKYSEAARIFLDSLAKHEPLAIEYIHDTKAIDLAYLNQYRLFIQLDYPPYGWGEKAEKAFIAYMNDKDHGWIGFHHATLLGTFDGFPMWDWFSSFMGGIRFKAYIPTFADGQVKVEDTKHPVMRNVKSPLVIEKEEWYTYDKSPRPNVHVIASVDESTYQPESPVRMGDHPVVWTNTGIPARNVYIFMGHGPWLFNNGAYRQLFINAISWTTGRKR